MAQQQRTRAQILALFADNVTGQISAEDLRDFTVTMMEDEFINPGDFWAEPLPQFITTDRTGKGWKMYSQILVSGGSFANVFFMNSDGHWEPADANASTENRVLGMLMDSYIADESQAIILRKGVVMLTALSGMLTSRIGDFFYLVSGDSNGSITTTAPASLLRRLGIVEGSSESIAIDNHHLRFDPDWSISGT